MCNSAEQNWQECALSVHVNADYLRYKCHVSSQKFTIVIASSRDRTHFHQSTFFFRIPRVRSELGIVRILKPMLPSWRIAHLGTHKIGMIGAP